MDSVAEIIGSVDTPLGLLALVVIGFFALAWKFGGKIIDRLDTISVRAAETEAKVDHVTSSIITNHGSKNIGDAIDRLTGWFMDSETERAENTQLLQLVATRLDDHISESEPLKHQLIELIARTEARAG